MVDTQKKKKKKKEKEKEILGTDSEVREFSVFLFFFLVYKGRRLTYINQGYVLICRVLMI